MVHYLIEAAFVGLFLAVLGTAVTFIIGFVTSKSSDWTEDFMNMIVPLMTTLFITGVLFHVLAEVSGINSWYCRNGYACNRQV